MSTTLQPAGHRTPTGAWRREAFAVAVLATLVVVVFAIGWQRTSADLWGLPTRYSGDDIHSLALLKAARDGHLLPIVPVQVPELGAPAGANWNGFLRQHKLQWIAGGLLARATGLWLAANLMLLGTHLLSALSFFGVARYLRARTEWAIIGALLFAFAPFMFWRGFGHLTVAACWPIPLGLLVLGWCTSRRPLGLRSRRFAAASVVTVLVGLHNIYFAALFAQFLVLAGLVRVARLRRLQELRLPLLLLALLVATVGFDNANQPLDRFLSGPAEGALLRPYGNLERFALKPVELLLPMPGSEWVLPDGLSRAHWAGSIYRGEMGSAYLGLAGILALAWLVLRGLHAMVRARPTGSAMPLLAIAWVGAFSVVGGGNSLLGLVGFVWLRGTNRFSIWILAIALLTAVCRIPRVRWVQRGTWSTAAALLVLLLSLLDQVPRSAASDPEAVRRSLASDHAFVADVEALLPEGGALFVEPALDFPEARRQFQALDYEPLRLYLHTSRLRFSYGTDKNRPGAGLGAAMDALDLPDRIQSLQAQGFSGIVVTCRALPDGGRGLVDELAEGGHREAVRSTDGQFVFVMFRGRQPGSRDALLTPWVMG